LRVGVCKITDLTGYTAGGRESIH